MLIPRFSIRWMLAFMLVAALLSLIAAWGLQGNPWAVSITVGVLALVAVMVVQASLFLLIWPISAAVQAMLPTRPSQPPGTLLPPVKLPAAANTATTPFPVQSPLEGTP